MATKLIIRARRIRKPPRVGPQHDGRRMSLTRFRRAHQVPGFIYELASGVIEVTDIPGRMHAVALHNVRRILAAYDLAHPGIIHYIGGGAEAKTEMPDLGSERHPDLSIYLTPMPDDEYPWDKWAPTIVIEIVSPGAAARKRDLITKRREYLAAGVLEYWIIDPQRRTMLALSRHGDTWREERIGASGRWRTRLLPGFVLDLSPALGASSK